MLNDQVETNPIERIRRILAEMERVIVAYSGGTDSSLLALLATSELGENALAVTAVSPSLSTHELKEAQAIASQFAIPHVLINSQELDDPRYVENTTLRCYWCKQHKFSLLTHYAHEHNFRFIVDGTNLDDFNDQRPGHKAASEFNIRSPLAEARLFKADIRHLANQLGLPNWKKPADACLSSRIPYGYPISIEILQQIERAESVLRELGIQQVRVRHHDFTARLEVEPADFEIVLSQCRLITKRLKSLGYHTVTLDLEGYRSGSLNEWNDVSHET